MRALSYFSILSFVFSVGFAVSANAEQSSCEKLESSMKSNMPRSGRPLHHACRERISKFNDCKEVYKNRIKAAETGAASSGVASQLGSINLTSSTSTQMAVSAGATDVAKGCSENKIKAEEEYAILKDAEDKCSVFDMPSNKHEELAAKCGAAEAEAAAAEAAAAAAHEAAEREEELDDRQKELAEREKELLEREEELNENANNDSDDEDNTEVGDNETEVDDEATDRESLLARAQAIETIKGANLGAGDSRGEIMVDEQYVSVDECVYISGDGVCLDEPRCAGENTFFDPDTNTCVVKNCAPGSKLDRDGICKLPHDLEGAFALVKNDPDAVVNLDVQKDRGVGVRYEEAGSFQFIRGARKAASEDEEPSVEPAVYEEPGERETYYRSPNFRQQNR